MKWISVEDQLPEHGIEVLLYHSREFLFICMGKYHKKYNVFEDTQSWDDVHGAPKYRIKDDISHWMPLPEPPNNNSK